MEGSLVAYKVFTNGSVLNASEINDNLMNQSVMVFSNSTARAAALTAPVEGMLTWLQDTNKYEYRNGSGAWVALGGSGILQIVSTNTSTPVSTTSTSYVTTGITATITPSSTSSKIAIFVSTGTLNSNNSGASIFTIFRGTVAGTNLATGTHGIGATYNPSGLLLVPVSAHLVDSPNTVSAQTYTFAMKAEAGNTVTAQNSSANGSMILMEVAG